MEIQEKKKSPEFAVILAFAIMAFIKLVYLIEGAIINFGNSSLKFVINKDVFNYIFNSTTLKHYLFDCLYSIVLFAAIIILILKKKRCLPFAGVIYLIALKSVVNIRSSAIIFLQSTKTGVILDGITAVLLNLALISVLLLLVMLLLSQALDIEKLKEKTALLTKLYKIFYITLTALTGVHIIVSIVAYKSLFGIDFVNIAWLFAVFSMNKMIAPNNKDVISGEDQQ